MFPYSTMIPSVALDNRNGWIKIIFGQFLNWSIADTQCYIHFRCTTFWFDDSICHHSVLTVRVVPICQDTVLLQYYRREGKQCYYSVIDCIPYAVLFISVTDLFYNWKFRPLNSLHLFQPQVCSLNLRVCLFFVLLFKFYI